MRQVLENSSDPSFLASEQGGQKNLEVALHNIQGAKQPLTPARPKVRVNNR